MLPYTFSPIQLPARSTHSGSQIIGFGARKFIPSICRSSRIIINQQIFKRIHITNSCLKYIGWCKTLQQVLYCKISLYAMNPIKNELHATQFSSSCSGQQHHMNLRILLKRQHIGAVPQGCRLGGILGRQRYRRYIC